MACKNKKRRLLGTKRHILLPHAASWREEGKGLQRGGGWRKKYDGTRLPRLLRA